MTQQLETWKGPFGEEYTDRNEFDWKKRQHAFGEMLADLSIQRVLEVGCNRGYNLVAIQEHLGDEARLTGVEPNPHALELAEDVDGIDFLQGNAYDLPFEDGSCDIVFTAGVLIHIPGENLSSALAEIHRVSNRYILAVEYFAEEETEIPYRGNRDLLWKRDFQKEYMSRFPSLSVVRKGYWDEKDGFDRAHWWLFDKK
jgi:pseudaminic acid biosynthesis-associated methylase